MITKLVQVFICLTILSVFDGCRSKSDNSNAVLPANSQTEKNTAAQSVNPASEKLEGKWLRSDGNYTIEIFSVSAEGKADAGYFNPGPINVEKAEWKINDNKLYFRIILKDVNYPGSNYTLEYIPQKDMLVGNYFQAVQGLNYDVTFSRVK